MVRGASSTDAQRRLGRVEREIRRRLGEDLYGEDDETLALVVGRRLQTLGLTLATAESCTAGMLAASVTDVPGSSGWFRGGVVVYHDDLKQSMAGVPRELLDRYGAVSEPVARALAEDVRSRCGADIGIAVTGIAGPGGGTDDKPVGRVHIALAERGGTEHWQTRQVGDRQLIRRRSVTYALDRLRRLLAGRTEPG
jgi:nicotinamide-nucleotide amidase